MRAFQLHIARSVDEALDVLARYGMRARPLGGGTDLVVGMMRDQIVGPGLPYPEHLVDITNLSELRAIDERDGGVEIGAAVTLAELAQSPLIRRWWPALARAASEVASPEIRAVATVGGNLHQRPRCWFFRNRDFDCLKKGGDICYAIEGDHRYNAIVDGAHCFIVHPSDLAVVMVAFGGIARVRSPAGLRAVPLEEYFIGPDRDLLREAAIGLDELLVSVWLPRVAGSRQAWLKMNEKGLPTWDFALASAAVVGRFVDSKWQGGRIVLGAVAPVPWRATVVEDVLRDVALDVALPDALEAFRRVARPMPGNAYKVDLATFVLEQALRAAQEPSGAGA